MHVSVCAVSLCDFIDGSLSHAFHYILFTKMILFITLLPATTTNSHVYKYFVGRMNRQVRVCVVGAGAAGLCAARHLCRLPRFFTVYVIESTAYVGGTWRNPDKSCGHRYVKLLIVFHISYSEKAW